MKVTARSEARPGGVTALGLFSLIGAVISFTSCLSLLFPQSFLQPMWRLNPRAYHAFVGMGGWAIVLLGAVCVACVAAGVGLLRGTRWGYRLAVSGLVINMLGDAANVLSGTEPRAIVGIPIAAFLLAYLLSRRVRHFFRFGALRLRNPLRNDSRKDSG